MKEKKTNFPSEQKQRELFKKNVTDAIQAQVHGSIRTLAINRDSAKATSIDADGPWQSTYDTTKKEQAWLSNSLDRQIEQLEISLRNFLELTKNEKELNTVVSVGSIIRTRNCQTNICEWFVLVSGGIGGRNLKVESEEIMTISTESKLGKLAVGKRKGGKFLLENNEFEIIEVI